MSEVLFIDDPVGVPPTEDDVRDYIAWVYGVPREIVGGPETSNRAMMSYVTESFDSWLRRTFSDDFIAAQTIIYRRLRIVARLAKAKLQRERRV